ncbi:MAG: NTP transferase domain-containing protein [Candidatus Thermoplasmatota archaeon]
MIAIIFAGGKGSRIGNLEKALLEVGNAKLIDYVINAIKNSNIKEFIVTTSPHTPKTAEYCKLQGYNVRETSGEGYHEDVRALLKLYPVFISIASDIPFLTSSVINTLVKAYKGYSVIGAIPLSLVPKNIKPSYIFKYRNEFLVPIGVNIVTKSSKSKVIKFREPLLGVNINTIEELEFARKVMENHKI